MFPFFTIEKEYLLSVDVEQGRKLLTDIVEAKYSSIKYSIYGSSTEIKDKFIFRPKHGYWRPIYATGGGTKIIVYLNSFEGRAKIFARVNTNRGFWIMIVLSSVGLIVSLFYQGQTFLKITVYLFLFLAFIGLDRLNKKVLLSLLERYI